MNLFSVFGGVASMLEVNNTSILAKEKSLRLLIMKCFSKNKNVRIELYNCQMFESKRVYML